MAHEIEHGARRRANRWSLAIWGGAAALLAVPAIAMRFTSENEAISFMLHCRDQAELDRHWAQLSHVPEAEQCGWCKDKYGLSWQVTPVVLGEIMASGNRDTVDRVTRAFLEMHKLDVAAIEAAAR